MKFRVIHHEQKYKEDDRIITVGIDKTWGWFNKKNIEEVIHEYIQAHLEEFKIDKYCNYRIIVHSSSVVEIWLIDHPWIVLVEIWSYFE